MNTVGFTSKYASLSNTKEVNSLAEVTRIGDKDFAVVQHGQRWHNRLSCWIKDSVRSFFSPLRKSTPNEAWERLSADLGGDTSIETDDKLLAQTKIKRWQKEGVPLRILHVRQLLRQMNEQFDSQPRTPQNFPQFKDGNKFEVEIQDLDQAVEDTSSSGIVSLKAVEENDTSAVNSDQADFTENPETQSLGVAETGVTASTEVTEYQKTQSIGVAETGVTASTEVTEDQKTQSLGTYVKKDQSVEITGSTQAAETSENLGSDWEELSFEDAQSASPEPPEPEEEIFQSFKNPNLEADLASAMNSVVTPVFQTPPPPPNPEHLVLIR